MKRIKTIRKLNEMTKKQGFQRDLSLAPVLRQISAEQERFMKKNPHQ